jgi:hypothetical protein
MSGFLEFVRTYDDREAYAACEDAGIADEYRGFFGPRVLEFTWLTERRAYDELMSRPPTEAAELRSLLEANPWGAYAGARKALDLAGLASVVRVVMVGCGPLPDTLLYLHDHTAAAALVGIEPDPDARRMARWLVERLRRSRIEILASDGREVDYGGFDLICCSVFATPRRPILNRIASTADPGTVVLLRDPSFTGTLLFESVLDQLPPGFEVRARSGSRPRGRFMLSYYALVLR